ncbi:hypothetical protein HDU98_004604 [Podochytrium sp. JEL0797]|nr:hypothetical protein HDU98_004604 [Podochytrium sp. JEL0797]
MAAAPSTKGGSKTRKMSTTHRLDVLLDSMRNEFERDDHADFSPPVSPLPPPSELQHPGPQPLFVPTDNTLHFLESSGRLLHCGSLLKLSDSAWKPRFFALTNDRRLFLFRENPRPSTKPVTFLPVEKHAAFFNELLGVWVLTVEGSGVNAEGMLVNRTWTLSCADDKHKWDMWVACLDSPRELSRDKQAQPHAPKRVQSLSPVRSNSSRQLRTISPAMAGAGPHVARMSRSVTALARNYHQQPRVDNIPMKRPSSQDSSLIDSTTGTQPSPVSTPSLLTHKRSTNSSAGSMAGPSPSGSPPRAFTNQLPTVLEYRAVDSDNVSVSYPLRFQHPQQIQSSSPGSVISSRQGVSFDLPRKETLGIVDHRTVERMKSHQSKNETTSLLQSQGWWTKVFSKKERT